MKRTIRKGVFETNSSATHAFTIYVGDYTYLTRYSEEEDPDDVYLDESDVNEILEYLPTEKLEEELKKRRKGNETN